MTKEDKKAIQNKEKRFKLPLDDSKLSEGMEIKDSIFFLPDDFERFKSRGSWVLLVKEGRLSRIDKTRDRE